MNLKLARLFKKWRRKREIKKICKANNFNCSECIHHEHIFEGAVFRGTRCRLEDGSSQFKRMAAQLGYEPVVHCKDCRLGEPDMIFNGYKDDFWCNYYEHPKPADGFCEKGKRKNDFVDDNKIGERRTDANEPDGT